MKSVMNGNAWIYAIFHLHNSAFSFVALFESQCAFVEN